MRRTKILNADEVRRKPFSEAKNEFIKHCRIKNLRPKTIKYYEEDIHYFHAQAKTRYVDEITQALSNALRLPHAWWHFSLAFFEFADSCF